MKSSPIEVYCSPIKIDRVEHRTGGRAVARHIDLETSGSARRAKGGFYQPKKGARHERSCHNRVRIGSDPRRSITTSRIRADSPAGADEDLQ